ncbi:radical S-adenosyl methionine domain-containing protein 1 [Nowakowskiella sp. JEL0407]|nr:radical S-adenosyl methionine domain-containing protein 1 [Nowakowskiella sp. JEL0407]
MTSATLSLLLTRCPRCTLAVARLISCMYPPLPLPCLSYLFFQPESFLSIVSFIKQNFNTTKNLHISLESNPTPSFLKNTLPTLLDAGLTRLSLGIQSLNATDLKLFNRNHTVSDIKSSANILSNFNREKLDLSIDMIYSRPNQKLSEWKDELSSVVELFSPNHISAYELTYERGTPLYKSLHSPSPQKLTEFTNDEKAEFYTHTVSSLTELGFTQYEVSSFHHSSSPQNKSRHNLMYWHGQDYIGVGPGAHGRIYLPIADNGVKRFKTFRILEPEAYYNQCLSPEISHGIRKQEQMSAVETLREILLFGFRMVDGVRLQNLIPHLQKYSPNQKFSSEEVWEMVLDLNKVEDYESEGLLEWVMEKSERVGLKATEKGFILSDKLSFEVIK